MQDNRILVIDSGSQRYSSNSVRQMKKSLTRHVSYCDVSKSSVQEVRDMIYGAPLIIVLRWYSESEVYSLKCPLRVGDGISMDLSPVLESLPGSTFIFLCVNHFGPNEYDTIQPSPRIIDTNLSLLKDRLQGKYLTLIRPHQSYQFINNLVSTTMDYEDIRSMCYIKDTYSSPCLKDAPTNWWVRQIIHPHTATQNVTIILMDKKGNVFKSITLEPGSSVHIPREDISSVTLFISDNDICNRCIKDILMPTYTSLNGIYYNPHRDTCECVIL
jgi:hypothetical protein